MVVLMGWDGMVDATAAVLWAAAASVAASSAMGRDGVEVWHWHTGTLGTCNDTAGRSDAICSCKVCIVAHLAFHEGSQ